MSAVKVSLDENQSAYIISGDVSSITGSMRAWVNFSDMNARIEAANNSVVVPFLGEQAEETYKNVIKLFQKFGITHQNSDAVQEQHERLLQETLNFNHFANDAKNIRNNVCDTNAFQNFTAIIRECLKGRILHGHQLLSAYHLAFSQHACNFSVPGAGKTSVVYAAFAYLNSLPEDNPKHVDKLLIIGPLSSFKAWEDEYKECFGKACNSTRLSGGVDPSERDLYFYRPEQSTVTLLHYQSLVNMVGDVKRFLAKNKVMMVIDEAHKIKNMEGVWTNAALDIAKHTAKCSRVILTGTPIPNGYQDLYSLYKFIWPDKELLGVSLGRLASFTGNSNQDSVRQQVNEMVDRISPFFIRIKKSDLDLPAPLEHPPLLVEMGPMQKNIYDAIESKIVPAIMDDLNDKRSLATLKSAKLLRLMQCATNPHMLLKPLLMQDDEDYWTILQNSFPLSNDLTNTIRNYRDHETPSKFVAVKDLLQSQILTKSGPRGKAIIWTVFLDSMDDLSEFLASHGIQSEMLRGATPTEGDEAAVAKGIMTREKIINRFHDEDSTFKVIIANPFTVGESISLHKACHNAIYMERNFNAAQYIQSKDRIHRVGLKPQDLINYYYVLSKDTVDSTIHDRLLVKERRMLEVIEREEIPLIAANLGMEEDKNDIQAIIRAYTSRKT